MQEITLDDLYNKWLFQNAEVNLRYLELKVKKKNQRITTFGEYHTWVLKEGKYKVI